MAGLTAGAGLTADLVAERLGFPPGSKGHRQALELESLFGPGGGLAPLDLPPFDEGSVAALLDRLGLPADGPDAADVLATLPVPDRSPEWWWMLEREVARLLAGMGRPADDRGSWPGFEGPDYSLDTRCHFAHVALAVVPHTLAYWTRLGVPEEIAWASMADVGRHALLHRRTYGLSGMDASWWVTLCLRGEIVDLGRLQYNRLCFGAGESPVWYPDEEAEAMGPGFRPGDWSLGIHIPDGPSLSPSAVADSIERAGPFFREFFPEETWPIATCMSWLLDPQLAEYLPDESNIVRFGRLFRLVPGPAYEADDDVLQFVFRPASYPSDLAALPQRTAMERAAVAHLQAGRHFAAQTGWLELP